MFAIKAVVLLVALVGVLPFSQLLRRNSRAALYAWVFIGILPFIYSGVGHQPLFITLAGGTEWPGYLKGAEFSVVDLLALAIYLSLPRTTLRLPFKTSMALYFIAAFLSIFQSDVPKMPLFYCWQLARVFLLFLVVAKASARDDRIPLAIMTGMTIGLCLQTGISMYQKFLLGEERAGGTLGGQNYLGLMTHFVIFPLFTLFLAGQKGWVTLAGPLAGIISSILTVSRAAIGINGIGLVVVYFLSTFQRWTSRKAIIGMAGVVLFVLSVPIVFASLERRYATADAEGSSDVRAAFNRAATMMISDYPMGVGASNYVRMANINGYNVRADLPYREWAIDVHNAFYLVTAETGYVGLFTFALVLLNVVVTAFKCGWQYRSTQMGNMLLGFGVALVTVYVHSWFEFIMLFAGTQYVFAITAGLIVGLATQLGYWRAQSPQSRRSQFSTPNAREGQSL